MGEFSWADVSDDLLLLLAERLGAATFIRFSAVCRPWQSVTSVTRCCKLVPWLMMIENQGSELRDFYDHSTGELYQFPLPGVQRVKNLGFAHGWLITVDEDCTFHLVNLLFGSRISLPRVTFLFEENDDLSPYEIRNLILVKATCSPIGPDGDGIVAFTYRGYYDFGFAFCRLNGQKWTFFDERGSNEVAFVDGVFYTISNVGGIKTLDFTSAAPGLDLVAHLADEVACMNPCRTFNCHIVEYAGDILIAAKIYSKSLDRDFVLTSFRLFKFDIKSKNVVEVKSIGDYALLLGVNSSFCLPTASYGKFFKKNCIYFINIDEFTNFGQCLIGEEFRVFKLDDNSFTTHYVGASKSYYSYPIWVALDPFSYPVYD